MSEVLIGEKLHLELPEGFVVMDKAEVEKAIGLSYDNLWGARDEGNHMMLVCIWKDAPALLGKLVSTDALVDRAEEAVRKAYAKSAYRLDDHFTLQIAGEQAKGFAYGFNVGDVAQVGEVIVLRHDKRTYTLYYYTRPECAADNRAAHDALLESIQL